MAMFQPYIPEPPWISDVDYVHGGGSIRRAVAYTAGRPDFEPPACGWFALAHACEAGIVVLLVALIVLAVR